MADSSSATTFTHKTDSSLWVLNQEKVKNIFVISKHDHIKWAFFKIK